MVSLDQNYTIGKKIKIIMQDRLLNWKITASIVKK